MKYVALIVFVTLSAILIGLIVFTMSGDRPSEVPGDALPVDPTPDVVDQDSIDPYMEIATEDGPVRVVNVRSLPDTEHRGRGLYTLTDLMSRPDSPYSFLFDSNDNSYIISIQRQPIIPTRNVAVDELRRMLEVSEEELCKLDITVMVLYSADPSYFRNSPGLGVCE